MGGKHINSTVVAIRVPNATVAYWRVLAERGDQTVAQWIVDSLPTPPEPMKNHNEDGPFP